MIIYSCNDIEVAFGQDIILSEVNIQIDERDRIGIIGSNGCGKTTFVKLLQGVLEPSSGKIYRYGKISCGYLPQNTQLQSDKTVIEEFRQGFSYLLELEDKISLCQSMLDKISSEKDNSNEILRISDNLEKYIKEYGDKGGNTYKSRIESILKGLGFPPASWELKIENLSGGQKTRLALGRILLSSPEVLILDEPTNHLDLDAIKWLEEELSDYKGTLLVISHDRSFLDAISSKTLLIQHQHVHLYNAPYSKYIPLREADILYQQRVYAQQQKEIERIEAFIKKQRQWNRERNIIAAESRMKQLDKMELVQKPKDQPDPPAIRFTVDRIGGNEVLDVKGLSFAFPDKELFSGLSFQIYKGERVFIKGPNGCGKSTLLKILTGKERATSGTYKIGSTISYSYYSQDFSDLNIDNTVFDEIWEYANKNKNATNLITPLEIRNALGAFNFTGEDAFKKISCLSGGEKSRIQLLKIMYDHSSLLILDEPTNHLDIRTRETLEEALSEFEGTIIAVSHDRYFTEKVQTREINIPDYCTKTESTIEENDKKEGAVEYLNQKNQKAKERKLRNDKLKAEKELPLLEERLANIEQLLQSPEVMSDYVRIQELCEERDAVTLQAERLMEILIQ